MEGGRCNKLPYLGRCVIHEDDLLEQLRRGPVDDAVHSPQQRRPALVVETHHNAEIIFVSAKYFLATKEIFSPGCGQLSQGQVAALGPAPGVAVVGQGAVEGDEVADVLGQSEVSTAVT